MDRFRSTVTSKSQPSNSGRNGKCRRCCESPIFFCGGSARCRIWNPFWSAPKIPPLVSGKNGPARICSGSARRPNSLCFVWGEGMCSGGGYPYRVCICLLYVGGTGGDLLLSCRQCERCAANYAVSCAASLPVHTRVEKYCSKSDLRSSGSNERSAST